MFHNNKGLRQFNGCPCIDARGPIAPPTQFLNPNINPNIGGSAPGSVPPPPNQFPPPGGPNIQVGSGPGPSSSPRPIQVGSGSGPGPGLGGPPFGPSPGGPPLGGPGIQLRPAKFQASTNLFARLSRAVYASSKPKE